MKTLFNKALTTSKTFLVLSILAVNTGIYADDTEIFISREPSRPNVLFALDTSNSMDRTITSTGERRIDALKESFRKVLADAPDNINIGLMAFGHGDGIDKETNNKEHKRHHAVAGVAFPITDINAKARDVVKLPRDVHGLPAFPAEDSTTRSYLADVADAWGLSLGTPIVDTIYEAALYFRGEKIHYGQDLPTKNGAHPSTYSGRVVNKDVQKHGRDRASAPKYISPIKNRCQSNYLILMTDGAPWYKYNRGGTGNNARAPFANRDRIAIGGPKGKLASSIGDCALPADNRKSGTCGAELTHYLATNDNIPDPSSSFPGGLEGNQYIQTFTVGFDTGAGTRTENYLKSLATYDDGDPATVDDGYFLANNAAELSAAFQNILAAVTSPKNTLASPGLSVNVKNGLEHEKYMYIPAFERESTSRWSGNLKKFKIVDVDGRRRIRGKNDLNATDENGQFTASAIDLWSNSPNHDPDGAVVSRGGVANLLDPDDRNIFTNLGGDRNINLSHNRNRLELGNISNLTNEVLGLPDTSDIRYRKRIVNFMRGWKNGISDPRATPAPEKRYHMGDMLHSEPLLMTYDQGSGATLTGKRQYIFIGTNEGYLHAFDAETGEEKFAFIPAELLKTISEPQYLNAGTEEDHKYGVDGAITGDFIGGADGSLDPGDQVIIYFGMRRGGTSFYALDVTDIENPKLLWRKSAEDHPTMGQSWSTPYVASVGEVTRKQPVVIVSGGYDDDEDRDLRNSIRLDEAKLGRRVRADVGNDILIFDTDGDDAGRLVWSMPDEMRAMLTSSIAGGLKLLDTNNNSLIDRIYFGDTGGDVWRLDLSENLGTSPSTLTKLASLGGTEADNRMFFNEPDVALMRLNGRFVYTVSIGSGFRAHPMQTVIKDKFYVLIDPSPFAPLETRGINSFDRITEAELATINVSRDGGISRAGSIADVNKKGWVINFPEKGEKVLGNATAINGSIIFPTLIPQPSSTGAGLSHCSTPVTFSRLYAIDILTGTAKWDFNDDGVPVPFTEPLTSEIISSIQKVFNKPEPKSPVIGPDGSPTGETECKHTVDLRVGKKSSQVSGYNACRLESVYWSDPEEVRN